MGNLDRNKWKSVVLKIENYKWLKSQGQTADSFNDVIDKLRREKEEQQSGIKITQTGVWGSVTRRATPTTPTPSTFSAENNTLINKWRSSA